MEVEKGSIKNYERKYSGSLELPIADEELEKICIKQNVIEKINPPMYVGDKIGEFEVYIEDEKIYEKEILLEQNIYEKTPFDYIKEGIKNMFQPFSKI